MKYRLMGKTGMFVSEMSLGTMAFGGGNDFFRNIGNLDVEGVKEQVKFFIDQGGNLIDTANYYSNGLSEELVGQSVQELGIPRDEIILASKARLRIAPAANSVGLSRGHLFAEVEKSLKRLKTDYIDLFQLHGIDELTPIEETLRALDDLVCMGKIRYIGVCNYPGWEIMKGLSISDSTGKSRFATAQMHYSLACRDIEREVVPVCIDQSVGIMAWSPLSGGYLSGKYQGDLSPEGRRKAFPFPPVDDTKGKACLIALRAVSERVNASMAQVALAYLLTKPAMMTVIVGARNIAQLKDNISALTVKLSDADIAELDTASELPSEYPGWMMDRQSGDREVGAIAISNLPSAS